MLAKIQRILDERGWLLADGATGTNLFDLGLEAGEAPELWNEAQPGLVRKLYEGFVHAGSDLFLTNSFGSNRARLKLHGAGSRSREISRMAAEIAREVSDRQGGSALVAGSVGPTGELMEPLGPLTHTCAVELFAEQGEGLKEGGSDLLWVETMSSWEEFTAAADACAKVGLPWCGTMSFDTAGRTMMGIMPTELTSRLASLSNPPIAFGANCGAGAADLVRVILEIAATKPDVPIIAKGNAGIPKFVGGKIHYDGSPSLMAEYAVLARNAGASIIGGCCGTTPFHLECMRRRLEGAPRGSPPQLAEVEAKLGDFTFSRDKLAGTRRSRRERRRRN